jgi:hypothetical protein
MKRLLILTTIIHFLVSWTVIGKAEEKAERVHAVKPKADLVQPGKPATIPTEFHYTIPASTVQNVTRKHPKGVEIGI